MLGLPGPIGPRMANSSTSVAAAAPASCEPAHAANSRARARIEGSSNARSTASRTGRGEMNRCGTRTPAPAHETRAAFSFMSPTAGQATTVLVNGAVTVDHAEHTGALAGKLLTRRPR